MEVKSVNIGGETTLTIGDRAVATGIAKEGVGHAVAVTSAGLEGDVVKDQKHHGGPDQAVYVYGMGDYAYWNGQLEAVLAPGTFGENLTISELETAELRVGDRLRVGPVLLEVTAPRIPCGTLSSRVGIPDMVKRFRNAVRPGVYCRVLEDGSVQKGDPVSLEPAEGESLTMAIMFDEYYRADQLSEEELRRYLALPIAARTREAIEELLAKFQ